MSRISTYLLPAGISIFCFISQKADAQKIFFIFAHGLYGAPVDQYFRNNYSSGYGVEAGAAIGTGKTFFVATTGYSQFLSKSGNSFGNSSVVPIKGGIRKYLFVGKVLYVHLDAGVAIIKNNELTGSRFSGDAGAGVKLGPIEIQADYDGFTRSSPETSGYSSWIGIKAGFRFGL